MVEETFRPWRNSSYGSELLPSDIMLPWWTCSSISLRLEADARVSKYGASNVPKSTQMQILKVSGIHL